MPFIIFILILALPIVELTLLIEVGQAIGSVPTVLLTIFTAVAGLWIVRMEGLAVARRMQQAMARGEPIVEEMIHGFFLFLAGLMLLFPGFLTDAAGAVLLLPPVRLALGNLGVYRVFVRKPPPRQYRDREGHLILEGEYREKDAAKRDAPDGEEKD